ncbi:hypothetical protein PR202_gb08593 [Eleusine coracana subsp. coracana]|uniref:Uncharacterized protein n=1 Tax=Eleusine coracana subsp. coracana TaxID=191504 RepID=A0AAV5EEZ4_ELECO|nr:hypothetical protein PR202_gb08593 [Eleusine coracana subsp. coracana]
MPGQQGGGASRHRQGPEQDQEAEHDHARPPRDGHRHDRRVAGERDVLPPLGAEEAEQPVQVSGGPHQGLPQAEREEAAGDRVVAAAAGGHPGRYPG